MSRVKIFHGNQDPLFHGEIRQMTLGLLLRITNKQGVATVHALALDLRNQPTKQENMIIVKLDLAWLAYLGDDYPAQITNIACLQHFMKKEPQRIHVVTL